MNDDRPAWVRGFEARSTQIMAAVVGFLVVGTLAEYAGGDIPGLGGLACVGGAVWGFRTGAGLRR